MWEEFKKFALRGNVLDLAIGVVIGAAFGKIVSSLVADVITPILGLGLGRIQFDQLYIPLSGHYADLAAARAAGAPTINYGVFLQSIVDFAIVAFVIFLVIRAVNRFQERLPFRGKGAKSDPTEKDCPFCTLRIPLKAIRCPHCAGELHT